MGEATGVFFYVFPGIAAVATFTLATTNGTGTELGTSTFGGIMQIGFSFGFGIAFAIITCASTSGGHFNPAITICLAIWQGFPWKKVPYYIFSQVGRLDNGSVCVALILSDLWSFHGWITANGLLLARDTGS